MRFNQDDKGYQELWHWFGLSYASFLTLPRVLMHEMPNEWQEQMTKLLKEYDETWDFGGMDYGTRVQFTDKGKLVPTPQWLINYRHPDTHTIQSLKRKILTQPLSDNKE